MPTDSTPLSRVFLLAAAAALLLGVLTIRAHLAQPSFPALPGKGCITPTFPRPVSRTPPPYLELDVCLHISESELTLNYHDDAEAGRYGLFEATGVEDPRDWARSIAVTWLSPDTVRVTYRHNIRFTSRDSTAGAVRILYVPDTRDGL